MNYDIEINDNNDIMINNIKINVKIFEEQCIDWKFLERDNLIDDLINWISEAKGIDKQMMKDDLMYLINLKDKYVFSSLSTNEYVVMSDNEDGFNAICKELLELNKGYEEDD